MLRQYQWEKQPGSKVAKWWWGTRIQFCLDLSPFPCVMPFPFRSFSNLNVNTSFIIVIHPYISPEHQQHSKLLQNAGSSTNGEGSAHLCRAQWERSSSPILLCFRLKASAHGLTARTSTGGYFPPCRRISLDSSECCWRHWAWSYFPKTEAFPYAFNSSLSSRDLVAKAPFQVFQNWTGSWQSQASERMRTESISAASHV